MTLALQTCHSHPAREAAARCVECGRFFCRECIAEHEGRLVCAGCLVRLSRATHRLARTWPRTARALGGVLLGFFGAWLFFYAAGRTLMTLPSEFHARQWWHETLDRFSSDE